MSTPTTASPTRWTQRPASGAPFTSANHRATRMLDWASTVDHKKIGILYMLTALVFFVIGGLEALAMRIQLSRPNNTFLGPETYNQLFTMHGTTMIFLVGMPLLIGLAIYLVPLMIGARDMAFPRLNAFGYWLIPFGGLLIYFSFFATGASTAGWFSYPPLSLRNYTLGNGPFGNVGGVDYWSIGLLIVGVGSVASAINLIATILLLRAPGMGFGRMPLFCWLIFVTAALILIAIPALNAALVMLFFDRRFGTAFFDPTGGGSPLLWQNFFWIFGHPEVYILILPAFAIISEVIPVFARKPIYGYEFVAGSGVSIGLFGLFVWAHHMFAAGLSQGVTIWFGAASMLIAVPTGVKIFNWIGTLWGGSLRFRTPLLFALAFILQFTVGGLSGIVFATIALDWQLTDTYFVVAHLHYVLFGGTVFAVFAGTYYWFPKFTGRMLSERLGRWHLWLAVIGLNATFFVQHMLGVMGMPRRVYTYGDFPGWALANGISTVGAVILGSSIVVFLWNMYVSLRHGDIAGDNPWDAWTLEWATTSPPQPENFDTVPPVLGRRPLYELTAQRESANRRQSVGRGQEIVL
ncbi:MAG: cytochrome c oxidase subunit I [Gemmatimonas sp.]|nr:cytochrome c oxidase subunit I [Gemmatimonas sp.]